MFQLSKIGHSARVCKLGTCCPRCAGPHRAGECSSSLNDFAKYKCALCGEQGHGSSYAKCPVRQEKISKLRDKKEGPRILPPPTHNKVNFPPLPEGQGSGAAPPSHLTHPLQVPAVRAVAEGLVAGVLQLFQTDKKLSFPQITDILSSALRRHANISIELNQVTMQAKLVATNNLLPSTLPINMMQQAKNTTSKL